MGLLSSSVKKENLQYGDHIYTCSYAHHGIYVADNKVIHFTKGPNEESGTNTFIDILLPSSRPASSHRRCPYCELTGESSGVVLSCLECFLADCPLNRFQYGENTVSFLVKGGACTLAETDHSEVVLHRAWYLYENGFGLYQIFHNNVQDFAVYCKTGLLAADDGFIARSGQAATFLGAPVAAVISSPLKSIVKNLWCMAAASAGVYFFYKYATDIGVRRDVIKIDVEELVTHVDWDHRAQEAQQ